MIGDFDIGVEEECRCCRKGHVEIFNDECILWFIAIETLDFGETFYKVAASPTTMQTTNKDFVQI
jgi:hypothetical protein